MHLLDAALFDAGGGKQHAPLGPLVGIADVDLQQEAIELGFGQRIGAFLLERVLGGQHMERRRHVVPLAGNGDVMLLHGLQQRRLGLGAGAVDLVGHQQLGEDRPLDEAEAAPAGRPPSSSTSAPMMSEGMRSGVNWMRLASSPRTLPSVSTSSVLARPGHADQQRMAAGQQGDERALDDLVLAEDDRGRRLVDALDPLAGRFDARDDVIVAIDQGCHDVNISPLFAFAKSCRGEDVQIMKD